jgi:hypothetical protein
MISVKLLLVIAKIHGLESKWIDFILAFPQADLNEDILMDLPIGFKPIDDPTEAPKFALKLRKNLYGLKQARSTWFTKLYDWLLHQGFKTSSIDQCLYMKEGMMLLVYVEDCIIVGFDMSEIEDFVVSMQNGPENFILTDEGNIDKFLGLEIKRLGPKEFEVSQLFLIYHIITSLRLQSDASDTHCNDKFTPAAAQILNKDLQGKPKKKTWKYRTAVGMMSYLQSHSQPDISMPVHQIACFSNDPKLIHKQAITHIGHYLLETKTRGLRYKIDCSKGLECYVDADFAGGWDIKDPHNASNLMSRMGFCNKVCRLSHLLVKQTTNKDCPEHSRGGVYSFIFCPLQGYTFDDHHERN